MQIIIKKKTPSRKYQQINKQKIQSIKWTTNEEVLEQTKQTKISTMIKKRKLEWYGQKKQRWFGLIRKDAYEAEFIDMKTFEKFALVREKLRKLFVAQWVIITQF